MWLMMDPTVGKIGILSIIIMVYNNCTIWTLIMVYLYYDILWYNNGNIMGYRYRYSSSTIKVPLGI
jgi:hypothetical protein